MTQELDLTRFAARLAAPMDKIFLEDQQVNQMWVIEGSDGLTVIETPWENATEKANMVRFVKERIKALKATRYLHIGEVWLMETNKIPESIRLGGKIASHPDRREALVARAEDRNGNVVQRIRYILRPEHGEATLSPAETLTSRVDETDGALTNLFEDDE